MIILGVNQSHNAGVTLSIDGEVALHIESERLNNIRYGWFPFPAIEKIKEHVPYIDHLVLSGTHPVVENINDLCKMDAYSAFVKSMGRSFDEHPFIVTDFSKEHHLTHAISAYYGSGFDTALCIVKDGAGSIVNTPIGQAVEIETSMIIDRENFYMVERRLWSSHIEEDVRVDQYTRATPYSSEADAFAFISQKLGFGLWDAGKIMGLSSYGRKSQYSFINEYGVDRQKTIEAECKNFEDMANISYAIQKETEDYTISYIAKMIEKTGINNVALSGGLFQNCVMNYKILKKLPAGSRLYVEPLSNDAGTSMGAVDWICRKEKYHYVNTRKSLYLGPHPIYREIPESVPATPHEVAQLIAERKIVAIFQGRSEGGTRALGNRSILYDPRDPNGKDRVNVVKKREWFRPFAGSVIHEEAGFWFDMDKLEESPYMLYAVDVKRDKIEKIPCIVHVNNTCRIQTVKAEQNKHFYELIKEFYCITGVPMVLNTSFNLAGDAIVETLDDALNTLYNSDIDVVYFPDIGRMVFNNR